MELKPLPCPFCAGTRIDFTMGTTYKWVSAYCPDCGAQAGEVRRDEPAKPITDRDKADALAEWNRRAESDLAAETLKWKITDEALHSSCDEVAKLKRENADLLAALKELVRLKDIKERIERGSELNGEWTDYEVNKEWAWQAARAAIARREHE